MSSTLTPSNPFAENNVAAAWNTASRVGVVAASLRGGILTNQLVNTEPGCMSTLEILELQE